MRGDYHIMPILRVLFHVTRVTGDEPSPKRFGGEINSRILLGPEFFIGAHLVSLPRHVPVLNFEKYVSVKYVGSKQINK